MWNRLVLTPWTALFAALFFYVLATVGSFVVKDLYIASLTIQHGRAAAIYQYGVDPSTGANVGSELAAQIQRVVPVDQASVTSNGFPPSANTIGIRQLVININYNDGSYVTTTMVYGAPLPLSSLLDRFGFRQATAIPLNMQVSFYREW